MAKISKITDIDSALEHIHHGDTIMVGGFGVPGTPFMLIDGLLQGILAEKIRAGGAGLFGILTDIGIDTILRDKKETVTIDGQEVLVEKSLRAVVALIHASVTDPLGNLIFEKSARNFNPAMATAANTVIVEVEKIVPIGDLDPDSIHLPGAFVDHIVLIQNLTDEYGILSSHVV
jgi:acetate CoA/acetoacetate CoA-transferase alpha subunit